jgi:catechol 2,3-dioxygenase-like lactoylglutathione lyase family enzyme
MQLRLARHTERLDEVVAFYRDGIGLREIGGFREHDGYDGVFLAVPGTGAHLELTAARLGIDPVPPANPYWAEHGLMFEDPDGFRVVLVPERWDG